jgi:integrase
MGDLPISELDFETIRVCLTRMRTGEAMKRQSCHKSVNAMGQLLKQALWEATPEGELAELVFPASKPRKNGLAPYQRPSNVRRQRVDLLLDSLGIERSGFHQSGHSFVQLMEQAGATIEDISAFVRHSDSSVTRSTYFKPEQKPAAVGSLARMIKEAM